MVHPSTRLSAREAGRAQKSEQESRSPHDDAPPNVVGMCFMFGASEEQIRRMLEEHVVEEVPVGVPAAEDCSQD
jgi:hypothetical protein